MEVENSRGNGHGYLEGAARLPVDNLADSSRSDNYFEEGNEPTVPFDHQTLPGDVISGSPAEGHDMHGSGPAPKHCEAPNDSPAEGIFSLDPDSPVEGTEGFPEAASPSRGPGRWLRSLIGVDEGLLDRVWEERARYTCLGAIVLGTAAMAALSMLDALDQIFGPIWPALILIALFWGAFICGIDRWLIASTHGVRGGQLAHLRTPHPARIVVRGDHRHATGAHRVRLGGRVTGPARPEQRAAGVRERVEAVQPAA